MTIPLPPPLGGPAPVEVPLAEPPLVRVIAQVRFAPILKVRDHSTVATFQETIRATYPILEEERVRHIAVDSAGTPDFKEEVIWRFSDRSRTWRVSLATNFVSLETTKYESRKNFLERLSVVLSGIEQTLDPQEAQRLGIRYIDRLTSPAIERISDLVRREILGVSQVDAGKLARHVLTNALFPAEEGQIQAKWGVVPPNSTVDAAAVEPIGDPSWILDLDMFTADPQTFTTDTLIDTAKRFTERIYTVFRWIVTEAFLEHYGGNR